MALPGRLHWLSGIRTTLPQALHAESSERPVSVVWIGSPGSACNSNLPVCTTTYVLQNPVEFRPEDPRDRLVERTSAGGKLSDVISLQSVWLLDLHIDTWATDIVSGSAHTGS